MDADDLSAIEERVDSLWEKLLLSIQWENRSMAVSAARRLNAELHAIPLELPGSAARPGIVGMLQFAVVSAALGDIDEAIQWRMRRLELLEEFLAADPDNELGLYCHADLRVELDELAHLQAAKHQSAKTETAPGAILPRTVQRT